MAGSPHGFSDGTNWTIPVVGALEDGPLIAPVTINGKGPYLFIVNARSRSILRPEVAKELDLYVARTNQQLVDSSDTITDEKLDIAEVPRLRIGNLTVTRRTFMVLPIDSRYNDTPVAGVIGGSIVHETLIWTIDRDRQMLHLATQGHQSPPPGATKVEAARIRHGKFFVDAKLDGKSAYLYVEPGMRGSGIWASLAKKANLSPLSGSSMRDWFGRLFRYRAGWHAHKVEIGKSTSHDVVFFDYTDQRVANQEWDGVIGMEWLARFHVTFNWHKEAFWLAPRSKDLNEHLSERVGRWGDALAGCAVGCVKADLVPDGAGVAMTFDRDAAKAGARVEAVFEAVDESGQPVGLPRLVVAFPPGATTAGVRGDVVGRYAVADQLRLVDLTPFPPTCAGDNGQGCVFVAQ